MAWFYWAIAWCLGWGGVGYRLRFLALFAVWNSQARRRQLLPGLGLVLDDFARWQGHDDPHSPPIVSKGALDEVIILMGFTLPLVFPGAFFVTLKALSIPLLPYLIIYSGSATLFPSKTAGFARWVVAEDSITKRWGLIAYALAVLGHWQLLAFFNACCLILHFGIWPRVGEIEKLYVRLGISLVLKGSVPFSIAIWLFRQNLKIPYWYFKRLIREVNQIRLWKPTVQKREEQYIYEKLRPGYIRVLDIYRRQPSDRVFRGEIQCRLRTVKLADPGKFDAISYTWGTSKPDRCIRIGDRIMLVKLNAYKILQDRASVRETRTIWIDCICINQSDVLEKNHQVTLMDEIYRRAVRTIIWLGSIEEYPDAELVLSLVGDLLERPMIITEKFPKLLRPWFQSRYARFTYFEGFDPRFPVLARLLEHEYFFRVWIMQEVVFSTKLHIRCGGCWIDWKTFATAMILMGDPATVHLVGGETLRGYVNEPCALGQISMLSIFRDSEVLAKLFPNPKPKLCHRLGDIWMAKSTDPRDMVFGVLNLCQEAKDPEFAADYGSLEDPKEFFTDIARRFHSRRELPEILHCAGIGYPSARENLPSRVSQTPVEGLPSWVPDWTCPPLLAPLRRTYTGIYNTSKDTKADIRLVSQTAIALPGIYVDQIASVTLGVFPGVNLSNADRGGRYFDICFQEIAAKRLVADLADIYHNKQPKMKAFWRTLICDVDTIAPPDKVPSPSTLLNMGSASQIPHLKWPAQDVCIDLFDEWNQVLIAIEESGLDLISCQKPLPAKWTPAEREAQRELGRKIKELSSGHDRHLLFGHLEYLGQINCGRKFAVTKKGYMAIVPPGTVRGDDVYVLDGLNVPFVTRSCQGGFGATQLVGECYVHGIMNGEMYSNEFRKVEVTLV